MRLTSGRWEGEPYEKGGASRPVVTFLRDFRLAGDLDGDGGEEAVVLLAQSSGGSGEFIYLAAVGRRDGAPSNLATVPLGDRVAVRAGRIENGRVVLDVVQPGEGDARCCPGDLVTRSWELQGGALEERAPERRGRLTPEAIGGTEWLLRSWTVDEDAAAEPPITLHFEGGHFAGSSGCNQYAASVAAAVTPGDLTVGPAASTRKMCLEPAMSAEARFLHSLESVTQFSFMAGQLALISAQGVVMLFDPAPD